MVSGKWGHGKKATNVHEELMRKRAACGCVSQAPRENCNGNKEAASSVHRREMWQTA